MKAKELIELLKDFPDFDVTVKIRVIDKNSLMGFNINHYDINGISDIGYSDKIIILEDKER